MTVFTTGITVLQKIVIAIGTGLCVWGGINLMEGYGGDNPGSKSQGFFIMVCVGIYAVLVGAIHMADNVHSALFGVAAYTVILCMSLMRTGSLSRSIFNAH